MAEVIGVRFKEVGKIYYFDPDGQELKKGDRVIVETVRGVECGEVALENREISDEEIVKPLKKLIRKADEKDLRTLEENKKKEKNAFGICQKKIADHKLDMKLVDVEYTFDGGKVLFYFTADGRVDFRELVKDLAGFLGDFQPVSIKMAKEQGLSLNPTKISGTCGRLMCCLKYEQNAYEYLLKITPKPGAIVETAEGAGTVVDFSLLTGTLKVKLHNNPDAMPKMFSRRDVKLVKDSRIKVDKAELEALKGIEDK